MSGPLDVNQRIAESWASHDGPCRECPAWHSESRPRYNRTDAKVPKVLVVGSDPNEERCNEPSADRGEAEAVLADQGKLPWMGQRGLQALTSLVGETRLSLRDLYVTNALRCAKPEGDLANAFKACNSYLRWELEAIQPRLVVCFGAPAYDQTMRAHNNRLPEMWRICKHHGEADPVSARRPSDGRPNPGRPRRLALVLIHWSRGEACMRFTKERTNGLPSPYLPSIKDHFSRAYTRAFE